MRWYKADPYEFVTPEEDGNIFELLDEYYL